MELSRDAARDARPIHRGLEAMQPVRLRDRWSALPVVLHIRRQPEPLMQRLFPDRIAGRRESRDIESAHGHSADRRIAISLPIKRGAAIRAEMKSNPIAAVGVALVDLPLPIEPHLLFRKTCAEMESGTGAALACLTVAQVHPIRFARGNYSKRAAVALPGSFHRSPPAIIEATLADFFDCRRAASKEKLFARTSTDVGPVVACATKISGG